MTAHPDWFAIIRKARSAFIRENYYEPTELYVPHHVRRELLKSEAFKYMGQDLSTLMGMAFRAHDGPVTLIARRNGRSFRWRMGHGFDQALVTPEERAAVWAP